MAVTKVEHEGSRPLSIGTEGGETTLIYKIAYADIDAYLLELGFVTVPGVGIQGTRYIVHPLYNWMFLADIRFEPLDPESPETPGGGATVYPGGMLVTQVYRTRQFSILEPLGDNDPDPPSGTFLTHTKDVSAEMMTLPDSSFIWKSDDAAMPPDVNTGKLLLTRTHRYSWFNVGDPPWTIIEQLAGRVNNTDWYRADDAECVLFAGMSDHTSYDTSGNVNYQIDYVFIERLGTGLVYDTSEATFLADWRINWNHTWRSDLGKWDRPKANGTAGDLYDTADFNLLFQEG